MLISFLLLIQRAGNKPGSEVANRTNIAIHIDAGSTGNILDEFGVDIDDIRNIDSEDDLDDLDCPPNYLMIPGTQQI